MPLYQFVCPKCGTEVELMKKLDDVTVPLCCEEGCSVEMVKVLSAPAFHLKGGGWAKDNYHKRTK
jgi:putative FmdB family regulatory protein